MAAQNKITLTIAGDSTGVERALARTESAAAHAASSVVKSSKDIGGALEGSTRNLRGGADVIDGMSSSLGALGAAIPGPAGNLLTMTRGFADLTDGAAVLAERLPLVGAAMDVAMGPVGIAIGVTAALAAGFVVLWKHSETFQKITKEALKDVGTVFLDYVEINLKGMKFLLDAAGHLPKWLGGGIADDAASGVQHIIDGIESMKGELASLTDQANGAAAALSNVGLNQQLAKQFGGTPWDPDGAFASADWIKENSTSTAAANMTAAERLAASTTKVAKAAGGSVAKVLDGAAQAAKDKLAKWQGLLDQFAGIADGIRDALGPKLVAGVASPLMLAKGTTLLDNLKTQLKDTLHLQSDLAKLSKMKLDPALLSQLTSGGLGSLGAADELLASGRSGVHAVNKVAGQINASGGRIAGAESLRQFDNRKITVHQTFDVTGGDAEFKKMFRKWIKTEGAKTYGLKAA